MKKKKQFKRMKKKKQLTFEDIRNWERGIGAEFIKLNEERTLGFDSLLYAYIIVITIAIIIGEIINYHPLLSLLFGNIAFLFVLLLNEEKIKC